MADKYEWDDVPASVRAYVESALGGVVAARPIMGGNNSQVSLRVTTTVGDDLFLKGSEVSRAESKFLVREGDVAVIAGGTVAPRLVWRGDAAGWSLLAYEFINGRTARFEPGSGDSALLADTLDRTCEIDVASGTVPTAEQRWASYIFDPDLRQAVIGSKLCHTDFNPDNVIISNGRAVLVDWAWATAGPAWLDLVIAPVWLIGTGGHTAREAEVWAQRSPRWANVPPATLAGFAEANARMWTDIAADNPGDWSRKLSDAARSWAAHLRT